MVLDGTWCWLGRWTSHGYLNIFVVSSLKTFSHPFLHIPLPSPSLLRHLVHCRSILSPSPFPHRFLVVKEMDSSVEGASAKRRLSVNMRRKLFCVEWGKEGPKDVIVVTEGGEKETRVGFISKSLAIWAAKRALEALAMAELG